MSGEIQSYCSSKSSVTMFSLETVRRPNVASIISESFKCVKNIPECLSGYLGSISIIGNVVREAVEMVGWSHLNPSSDNKEAPFDDSVVIAELISVKSGSSEKKPSLSSLSSDEKKVYPSDLNPFDGYDDEKIGQLNLNPRTKSKKSKKSKKSIRHMYPRVKGEKDSDGYPVEFKPFPRLVFQPLVEGVDPLIIQSQKQSDTLNDDQQAGLDLEAPSPPELNPSSGDKKTQQLDTSSTRRRPRLFTSQEPYWPELKPSSNRK